MIVDQRNKETYKYIGEYECEYGEETHFTIIKKEKSSKDLVITQVDSEGEDIETWNLHNFIIKSVAFGDLSYDDDGLVEITMNIAYDWAELT